jgi:hypothetical protein
VQYKPTRRVGRKNSDGDPGSGAFLTPVSRMEKNADPRSRINIPAHISVSFE